MRTENQWSRADGLAWPLTIYRCEECSRPSLFKEDRCCSGFVEEIKVVAIEKAERVRNSDHEQTRDRK